MSATWTQNSSGAGVIPPNVNCHRHGDHVGLTEAIQHTSGLAAALSGMMCWPSLPVCRYLLD